MNVLEVVILLTRKLSSATKLNQTAKKQEVFQQILMKKI